MKDSGFILFLAMVAIIVAPPLAFNAIFPNQEMTIFHLLWWGIAVWAECWTLKTIVDITTFWADKWSMRNQDLRG